MLLKDYYKTLEISPAASEQDIKRSFRRLVHRFHPDKNAGDAAAAARFREIREAYEVLADPKQREEYNYKRWYNRSLGKQYREAPLTPATLLRECERLQHYLLAMSSTRVDHDGLSYHIRQLLSETNIGLLKQFNDTGVNRLIVQTIIDCCRTLPWRYIAPIAALLQEVADDDQHMKEAIAAFVLLHRQHRRWSRLRPVIVVLLTLFLCWLIYALSK